MLRLHVSFSFAQILQNVYLAILDWELIPQKISVITLSLCYGDEYKSMCSSTSGLGEIKTVGNFEQ